MPRRPTQQSSTKQGDQQPVKDFDFNLAAAGPVSGTLSLFAKNAGLANGGTVGGIVNQGNVFNYLQNKGDLEQAILKKGMKKSEAAQLAQKYMND
mmetsp:Transcript_16506/g.28033  ORF Transcript_16506/g.28033 Transcript_16506/m.28033 type:complete len:95 (+) Transcript_16506:31-315(+)